MKKFILGIVIGLLVALPVGAYAWRDTESSKPIKGVKCFTSDGSAKCTYHVEVFDDADNKCYVAVRSFSDAPPAISCVKR